MPQDYRRFNGPENSVSYKIYTKDYIKSNKDRYKELLNENGLRKDGRELHERRRLFAKTEFSSQAKGSAYVEMKNTKVACSVFDPREIPHQNEFSEVGNLFVEVKFTPFSCPWKRRPYVPDSEEKALSTAVKEALEPIVCRHMFPNSQVDIFVVILEHDGACLAAAVNAAGLALADAVIPMYNIVTSCSAAVINGNIFIDPTAAEEYLASTTLSKGVNCGIITLSLYAEKVSDVRITGSMEITCVTNVLDILQKECAGIVPNVTKILVTDVINNHERKKVEEQSVRDQVITIPYEYKGILHTTRNRINS